MTQTSIDSSPVGGPHRAGALESLYVWLENSGYNRRAEYILRHPDVKEEKNRRPNAGQRLAVAGTATKPK